MPSTPAQSHAEQVAYWNGAAGVKWRDHQDDIDAMFAPALRLALAQAAPQVGEKALDVGCGCGGSTLALASSVGAQGRALGLDVSAPMTALARARARKLPNVEFLCADAAQADLPAQTFDLMFSRFGVMFFGDPIAAFAHLRRAMKPRGRFVFACWRALEECLWMNLPLQAACRHVPRPPRPGPEEPGPFSFVTRFSAGGPLTGAIWLVETTAL